MTIRTRASLVLLLAPLVAYTIHPVAATSGPGCFRVTNVAADDVLNVRAKASATADIVATLLPENDPGIIASTGECEPPGEPLESRWCPVKIYSGDSTVEGWAKRAFLAPSDCP